VRDQKQTSPTNPLTGHIHNFDRWKKDLTRSLKSFRLWLGRNQLHSDKVDQRLSALLKILKDDYVTIAFAGEFSRGKTELINAMFFANYGKRILPSQAGRTTMCPTELFFDQERQSTYLKLLPIETRSDPRPLNAFRELNDYWIETPLDTQSADSMATTLLQVTETKLVTKKKATELGFNPTTLEKSGEKNFVEIPKWRHALVSFDHPLLQKGLCILDTPGLNALGSEPELTLSLLPRAQAVIFLLAADAGVTASDMAIWDEHISQLKNRPNLGLYAVLNKVDVLWDELSTDTEIQNNVDKVIDSTAHQLGLAKKNVIPVSAQKGLLARVKNDTELLAKSSLATLEEVLSQAVMASKEQNLWDNVIADARTVVQESLVTLENRRKQLQSQSNEIDNIKGSSTDQVDELIVNCQLEKQNYTQKMLSIKPSMRLMERQTEILKNTLSGEKFQSTIDTTALMISNAKTTYGMLKGMRDFFFSVDAIMIEFCREAELSNKMAQSIFERFQQQHKLENFTPRVLTAKSYHRELKTIIRDSDQFNQHLKLALSGQNQVTNRFFNTTVYNIHSFFEQTRIKLDNWANNILHPLVIQIDDHRSVLETHMSELKLIQDSDATATGRLRALKRMLSDADDELAQCRQTLELLDKFKPERKGSNVLQFPKKKPYPKRANLPQ
jgi:hypothetical protein